LSLFGILPVTNEINYQDYVWKNISNHSSSLQHYLLYWCHNTNF